MDAADTIGGRVVRAQYGGTAPTSASLGTELPPILAAVDAPPTVTTARRGLQVVDVQAIDRRGYWAVKRLLDVVVALALLVVVSPVALLLAAAIRLDSRGPVIYRQQRLHARRLRTEDGWVWVTESFTLLKFRTMVANADSTLHRDYMRAYLSGDLEALTALRPGRDEGQSFRPADDPRVTRVGRWLRRLSLDELPQLWNVVRGDMSLVGPRPPLGYEVELYQPHQLRRLGGPCGMTGWAQIRGRTTIDFDEMVRLDLEYMGRSSVRFDLKVLLMTIPAVLSMRGAD